MTELLNAVTRATRTTLSPQFGSDKGRRLVVTLIPKHGDKTEDLIEIRPHGTRRAETITVADVYAIALKSRANRDWSVKMAERKQRKQAARERAAIARADRKLRKEVTS